MKLRQLAESIGANISSCPDTEIRELFMDSRQSVQDGLFFCISGSTFDGHRFARQAVEKGACALVVEHTVEGISVPQLVVQNSRVAMALAAAEFYGHADREMKIIGLTGTKGKTTTSYLVKGILEAFGFKCGLIGTIGSRIGEKLIKSGLTTPDPIDLHKTLRMMADEGADYVVMEVSAHAIALHRLEGMRFSTGCFTNLSQDHLDFFGTMDNYFECKKSFFRSAWLDNAAINADDERSKSILSDIDVPRMTFGIAQDADVSAHDIEISENGVRFTMRVLQMDEYPVSLKLTGMFNVYNALAAAAVCLNQGLDPAQVAAALQTIKGVPGRAELLDTHTPYKVILDYSHSPDALDNILNTVRTFARGRVIVLFGCGGDRDHKKRPIMGEIAGRLADYSILTSDNPRTEDPFDILRAVESGIRKTKGKYTVIENRREAIRHALETAREGDIVVLAGKGHETYQEINGIRHPFDEKVVVQQLLDEINQQV